MAVAITTRTGWRSSQTAGSAWESLVAARMARHIRKVPGQTSRARIFGSLRYRFRRVGSVSSTRVSDWAAFCFSLARFSACAFLSP